MNEHTYRVLIVDDERMVRDIAVRSFTKAGFQCDIAEDGNVAAAKFADQLYDAVITDLMMPNRNGHSLAIELVAHPARPFVVVVTAVTEPQIINDLNARGVAMVKYKPINHLQLALDIRRELQHRRRKTILATGLEPVNRQETGSRPIVSEHDDSLAQQGVASPLCSSDQRPGSTALSERYRVLIVDDEQMVRDVAVRSFTNAGFECETAEDGDVAALKFAESAYDAVVTDLMMPKRNGHSLAVELVGHPARPVVAVVTAAIEPQIASDLEAYGVAIVNFKPVDHSQLALMIRTKLDHRGWNRTVVDGQGQSTCRSKLATAAMPVARLDHQCVDLYLRCASLAHSTDEIISFVEEDSYLQQRVLNRANAEVSWKMSRRIDSVKDAVVHLGQRQVAELALTSARRAVRESGRV
ncbi:MAG: response regulator [Rhodopirellula sp.]|nr:response regulator [Rhodopirellula sp.]